VTLHLLDTNVLVDLIGPPSPWLFWTTAAVGAAVETGPLAINPVIYAELAAGAPDPDELEAALAPFDLRRLPLPYEAAYLAGRALAEHHRRGGTRASPLGDFYIGAHAAVADLSVITRDPRPYRGYFPSVRVIAPEPDHPSCSPS
jgi:hypothetical protein